MEELEEELARLRGILSALETKCGELEKQIKRVKKDIDDLREDKTRIRAIVDFLSEVKTSLNSAGSYIEGAKNNVGKYYNDSHNTSDWEKRLAGTQGLANGSATSCERIKTSGNETIGLIDKEIRKKQEDLVEKGKLLDSTKEDIEDCKNDIEYVQYQIDHYYDDE